MKHACLSKDSHSSIKCLQIVINAIQILEIYIMKCLWSSILAIVLISLIFFQLLSLYEKKEIIYEANGMQWVELSPELLVTTAPRNAVFILQQENENHVHCYKIISEHKSHSPSTILRFTAPIGQFTINDLLDYSSHASPDEADTLYLEYKELENLVTGNKKVVCRKIINQNSNKGFTETLEESLAIFLLISISMVFFLGLYRLVFFLINHKIKTSSRMIPDLMVLMLIVLFLYAGTTPDWYTSNKFSALSQYILSLFPVYFIFHWINIKLQLESKAFSVKILYRFVILLLSSAICVIIAAETGRLMDIYLFKGSEYTGIAIRTRIGLGLGVGYAFALADTIIQLIIQIIHNFFRKTATAQETSRTK